MELWQIQVINLDTTYFTWSQLKLKETWLVRLAGATTKISFSTKCEDKIYLYITPLISFFLISFLLLSVWDNLEALPSHNNV